MNTSVHDGADSDAQTEEQTRGGHEEGRLLHTDWRSNEALLYGTGSHSLYLVRNQSGKEYEGRLHIYVWNNRH